MKFYAMIEFFEGDPDMVAYGFVKMFDGIKFKTVDDLNALISAAELLVRMQHLSGYYKLYIDFYIWDEEAKEFYKHHGARFDIGDGYEANRIDKKDFEEYLKSLLAKYRKIAKQAKQIA